MTIMQTSTKTSFWLFLITFALVFYGMGAASVESFVNYPTWPLIGANEFRAYHRALGPLIIGYMVIPMLVATILTILLVWFRPASIPPVDGLAGDRVAAGCLDFHLHYSVADPGTIECGRLVVAADRPLARDQFLASPSATHCQCISFSVDDVRIAAGKCQAQCRSLANQ
jgi:hypothetical protein